MIGGPYRGSWNNVRRATTFWFRLRSRRRWRHRGKVDNEIPVVGTHTRPGPRRAVAALLLLAVPALAVNLLGLWALAWVRDFGTWHLGSTIQVSLLLGVTLGLMARSLSASVAFPVCFLMGW